MNRAEQIKYCKYCTKRKFDSEKGIICSLTNKIPNFEINCINYEKDNSLKVEYQSNKKIPNPTVIVPFLSFQ